MIKKSEQNLEKCSETRGRFLRSRPVTPEPSPCFVPDAWEGEGAGGTISPWVREMLNKPEIIGRSVGFRDLTEMHGDWIYEMVYGEEDYTLQAHRGSYKSSCLAVAIAMMMVVFPGKNIIFLRKTDAARIKIVQNKVRDSVGYALYYIRQGGTHNVQTNQAA